MSWPAGLYCRLVREDNSVCDVVVTRGSGRKMAYVTVRERDTGAEHTVKSGYLARSWDVDGVREWGECVKCASPGPVPKEGQKSDLLVHSSDALWCRNGRDCSLRAKRRRGKARGGTR